MSFSLKALPFQGFQLTSSDLSLFGLSENHLSADPDPYGPYTAILFFISAVLSLVPETSSFPTLRNRGKFPNRHLNHKPLLFPSSGPEYCKDLIFSLPFLFCPFCLVSCTSVFLRPNELITQCVIPSFRQTLLHYYLPPKPGVSGPGRFPPGIPPGSLTGASDPITVIVDDIVNEVSRLSPP